jgi:SM-20-related protein
MVLYLNKNWEPAHGGELRIFLPEKQQGEEGNKGNGDKKMSEKWVDIAPVAGRLVCFRSDTVEHEVLTAFQPRKSVTGWMLDQPLGLGFL